MPPSIGTRAQSGTQQTTTPMLPPEQRVEIPDIPLKERLLPGSSFHQTMLSRLIARRNLSQTAINKRYDDWNRVDEHVRLFIDLSRRAKEGNGQSNPSMLEMPFKRSIVVPLSYAILQVRMTQLLGIFLQRDPMIELSGRGPEDERPSRLIEAVLAYDAMQSNVPYQLYSFLQDSEKYGIAIMYDVWAEEQGWKTKRPDVPPGFPPELFNVMLRKFGGGATKEWTTVKEYNQWEAIDPFLYWPDPRVPLSDVQRGEFAGHRAYRPWTFYKSRSEENGGPYFNVDYLGQSGVNQQSRSIPARDKKMLEQFTLKGVADEQDRGYFTQDHLQIRLIPRDWMLSEETKPEIWWFTWVDDAVIIRAHKAAYDHGQYTYAIGESNPDPHALSNPGTIENLDGIARFTNWLLNSHLQNLMKFLNDSLIYAPSLIEEQDLLNPGPARHVRLSQKGEDLLLQGRLSMESVVYQMKLQDVTQTHLQAVQYLTQLAQLMTAANDPLTGQKSKGRTTLGEVQKMAFGASQRVSTTARMIDAMALMPLSLRAISNRQQFTSLEQYYRITGRLVQSMGGIQREMIRPEDIRGDFDYIPHSGAQPPDPGRQADIWVKLLETIVKYPPLAQAGPDGRAIDVREIFNETVRTAGIKNIDQFYIKVLPDGQVNKMVEQGNAVPTPSPRMRSAPTTIKPTFGTSNEGTTEGIGSY